MWLTDRTRARLAQARDVLSDNTGVDQTIDRIARQLGLSPFHFIRRFEAVFGETPHQFRIRRRIERAKSLLTSGHSVTDACLEVGFSSLGTFSTLFTRRVGETPSAYRRRTRLIVQVPETRVLIAPGCLTLLAHLPPSAISQFSRSTPSHVRR